MRGVVDHLGGGGPLLLDERELVVGGLDLGPLLLERLGGVGRRRLELGGPLDQGLAVGQVGGHAAEPGGGLVAPADRRPPATRALPQGGGELAADALVFLDPT